VKAAVFRDVHDIFRAVADAQRVVIGIGMVRPGDIVLPMQDGHLFTLRPASSKGSWKLEVQRTGWTPVDAHLIGTVKDFLSEAVVVTGQQEHNGGRLHEFFFKGVVSFDA
jgi:hypothetical protein